MHGPTVTRSAVAGAVAWAASCLAAASYVAQNGWDGAKDLPKMALWSASFGAVVSLAAAACRACVGARSVLWLHGTAMVLGPVLGFGCFALATLVRPGWVVAFPVFSCWAYGGFLALLGAGATTRSAKSMWATAGLGTLASVALVWSHAVLRRLG